MRMRIAFAELNNHGRKFVVSTVMLDEGVYETMAIYLDGTEIVGEQRTKTRTEALEAHKRVLRLCEAKFSREATKKPATTKRASRENMDGYKVGDLFYSSWGYEQTNKDFYQVVATTEKSLVLREIAYTSNYEGSMHGTKTPRMNDFVGEPFRTIRSRDGLYNENSSCRHLLFPTTKDAAHFFSQWA